VAVLEMRLPEKHLLPRSEALETGIEKGNSHSPLSKACYHWLLQTNGGCLVINADISIPKKLRRLLFVLDELLGISLLIVVGNGKLVTFVVNNPKRRKLCSYFVAESYAILIPRAG
jgi:hypothetical protein